MSQIISPAINDSNTFNNATIASDLTISLFELLRNFLFLSKRQIKILKILHEDYCQFGKRGSARGVQFYANYFKVSRETISRDLSDIKERKLVTARDGGCTYDSLCITSWGISLLDNYASQQMSQQNAIIPYIDLSKSSELTSKILKASQNCEQEEEIREPETVFDEFERMLEYEKVTERDRTIIKHKLNQTRIGSVRKELVIGRVIAQHKKLGVKNFRRYLITCLENEEKTINELKNYFANKPIEYKLYAHI